MDVWRTEIRVVQSADTDEPDGGTGLRIVAPNCHPAGGAAGDLLAPAARRGRHDDFGFTGDVHDTIGFIKSVERMRGPGLALAPTAMTGMNDQWSSDQTISDLPARASAFHVQLHRGGIVSAFEYRSCRHYRRLEFFRLTPKSYKRLLRVISARSHLRRVPPNT